jgi:inorganic pyrophosphatase
MGLHLPVQLWLWRVLKKKNHLPKRRYIWGGSSASTPYIPHSFFGKYVFQHPRFILNAPAPDGEGLDACILGVFEPLEIFRGKCIAVIHRLNNNDDKLIVVPVEKSYTAEQITALIEFQESFFESSVTR